MHWVTFLPVCDIRSVVFILVAYRAPAGATVPYISHSLSVWLSTTSPPRFFHRWGNEGSERLGNLCLTTELASCKAAVEQRAALLEAKCFSLGPHCPALSSLFCFLIPLWEKTIYIMLRILKISRTFKWKFLLASSLSHCYDLLFMPLTVFLSVYGWM